MKEYWQPCRLLPKGPGTSGGFLMRPGLKVTPHQANMEVYITFEHSAVIAAVNGLGHFGILGLRRLVNQGSTITCCGMRAAAMIWAALLLKLLSNLEPQIVHASCDRVFIFVYPDCVPSPQSPSFLL